MYAIVEISGKQFKVEKGDELNVPLQDKKEKTKLKFDSVLLLDDEGKVKVGTPFVKKTEVLATVVGHGRDKKILVFKKKRRKGYKKKNGHRQNYTTIKIDKIAIAK
ncbi:MAG: 50S ribosomal protein L21 [Bacteroidota bacterium]|nr:50S ribosomal protein L21 [Bacteroidota bacterium]